MRQPRESMTLLRAPVCACARLRVCVQSSTFVSHTFAAKAFKNICQLVSLYAAAASSGLPFLRLTVCVCVSLSLCVCECCPVACYWAIFSCFVWHARYMKAERPERVSESERECGMHRHFDWGCIGVAGCGLRGKQKERVPGNSLGWCGWRSCGKHESIRHNMCIYSAQYLWHIYSKKNVYTFHWNLNKGRRY